MTTEDNLIYSKSALKRMWGLVYRNLTEIQVRPQHNAIWTYVPGYRPRYVSKQEFLDHFVEYRQAAAKGLRVFPNSHNDGSFRVLNPQKKSIYTVSIEDNQIRCECQDFNNQERLLETEPKCKHIYAVFSHLEAYQIAV